MTDALKQVTNLPETVAIGGKTVNLRWTKRAMFHLNMRPEAESAGPFAHLCHFIWAMAKAEEGRETPWKEPEDVADDLDTSELSRITEIVEKLVVQGNRKMGLGGDLGPLSENGPSPETDSESQPMSS
jgi:hypothetical protein